MPQSRDPASPQDAFARPATAPAPTPQAPVTRAGPRGASAANTAEAAAVHESLDGLTGRAKQMIAQGETIARELQLREERVRELSRNVLSAAKQLCDLLARLQTASAESRRERQAACETNERLVAATRESRRVIGELRGVRPSVMMEDSTDSPVPPPRVVATASASRAAVAPSRGLEAPSHKADDLQRILRETQESLADLRRIARPRYAGDSNG